MEDDPIAQKHLAKLSKYRGEYDEWGNRLTRSMLNTRHLLELPKEDNRGRTNKKKLKKQKENQEEYKGKTNRMPLEFQFSEY